MADPARAWLRGVRTPLVCMLVGAVFGMLNNPLSSLIVAAMHHSTAGVLAAFGLVGGVATGLTTLMGIALLAPIAGDGRSRKGGAAVMAFVLATAYTGCMIARALIRFAMSGADRQTLNGLLVWNTIVTVGAGLMPLVMIVLVMVMARSGRPSPVAGPTAVPTRSSGPAKPARPHGAGAGMIILAACIVVVVCDLLVSVLYRGPLSKGAVLGSLYSAVNAIMFVLAVMLPLVALAGRLRETTGVNRHTAILVVAAVCALAQVVSVSCTIASLWLADQALAGAISSEEHYSRMAPLNFANTVMGVVFYLAIIVAVVIMLVAVSKAARGVSGPARPAAYAPAPGAPVPVASAASVPMAPYASPAPYAAPRPAPAAPVAPAPVPGRMSGYAAPASPSPLPPSAPAAAPTPGAVPAPLPAGQSAPAPSTQPPYPRR